MHDEGTDPIAIERVFRRAPFGNPGAFAPGLRRFRRSPIARRAALAALYVYNEYVNNVNKCINI